MFVYQLSGGLIGSSSFASCCG